MGDTWPMPTRRTSVRGLGENFRGKTALRQKDLEREREALWQSYTSALGIENLEEASSGRSRFWVNLIVETARDYKDVKEECGRLFSEGGSDLSTSG